MKVRRIVMVLMVVGLVAVGYFATVGWSKPVKDFIQAQNHVITPPPEPSVSFTVTVEFRIVDSGFSSSGFPIVAIDQVQLHKTIYGSFEQGKVYQNEKLNLLGIIPKSPTVPEYPSKYQAQVVIVGTYNGFEAWWNDTTRSFTTSSSTVSLQSGRAFIPDAGTYLCEITVVCTSPAKYAGAVFASSEVQFELTNPWG